MLFAVNPSVGILKILLVSNCLIFTLVILGPAESTMP